MPRLPPLNVLIVALGSHGDVHPFVGYGLEMRRRGHRVTVFANGHFGPLATAAGLDHVPLGTAEQYRQMTNDPDLWHRTRGFKAVFSKGVIPWLRPIYDAVVARHEPGRTLVVASSIALGVRAAQETLGFPMATVHLAPSIFRSLSAPPKLPGLVMPAWYPAWLKRSMWAFGDKHVVDPVVCPGLNAFRAGVGLPPVRRVLADWWNSPDLIVAAFPDWFAKPAGDWWPQTKLAGFPLWDERGVTAMPDGLEAFLAGGDAPVAFTPGSAMRFGQAFFTAAADACRRLRRRGLLLTRFAEQVPTDLPAGVIHVPFAPFSQLLPRCAALVHHGGIGTTSQGLAAGVPQLVMPMSHDQPDNALRVTRLGVGDALVPRKFTGRRVAAKLGALLASESVRARCADVRATFTGADGIATACDLFEDLAASRIPRPVDGVTTSAA